MACVCVCDIWTWFEWMCIYYTTIHICTHMYVIQYCLICAKQKSTDERKQEQRHQQNVTKTKRYIRRLRFILFHGFVYLIENTCPHICVALHFTCMFDTSNIQKKIIHRKSENEWVEMQCDANAYYTQLTEWGWRRVKCLKAKIRFNHKYARLYSKHRWTRNSTHSFICVCDAAKWK